MRPSTQDPPIRTRVGQFDSALLRYAATRKTCRTTPVGLLLGVGHPRAQLRSARQPVKRMFNTTSQAPAASGHLPDPRPATGGVAAKWKALLFMAGVLFLFPLAL